MLAGPPRRALCALQALTHLCRASQPSQARTVLGAPNMALLAHHQLCFCRRRPPPDARLQTTRRASRLYPHASAAADSPTATTAPFSFDALSQWCTARGAFIHSSLGVSDIPGAGRGLVATTPVAAGTVLARLPFSVCLYAARDPGEGDDSWSVTRQLAATALEFSRQAENAPVVAAWPRENCVVRV